MGRMADRLEKSCEKMRGAALKLGQICVCSQEESVLPPGTRDAMERHVLGIYDKSKLSGILRGPMGTNRQTHFREINLFPFAGRKYRTGAWSCAQPMA